MFFREWTIYIKKRNILISEIVSFFYCLSDNFNKVKTTSLLTDWLIDWLIDWLCNSNIFFFIYRKWWRQLWNSCIYTIIYTNKHISVYYHQCKQKSPKMYYVCDFFLSRLSVPGENASQLHFQIITFSWKKHMFDK